MCLTLSKVAPCDRWNWDGDRIIHECIVPASRPVVGYTRKRAFYDIDVREFLVTERNEVMRKAIRTDIREYVRATDGADWELFQSRRSGSFDHRAFLIAAFVAGKIAYRTARQDYWQFPDETFWVREGDCEDRALLIASLLLASGVSGYNVRVALGQIRIRSRSGLSKTHDHAWVMYKKEDGRWTVLEPLDLHREAKGAFNPLRPAGLDQAEYIPFFVFNDAHLWEVFGPVRRPPFQQVALRRRWSRIHPRFAGEVHYNLLSAALRDKAPAWFLKALQERFTRIPFVGVLDDIDLAICDYDPRDHFDNGYVVEGWARANDRLATFRSRPLSDPAAIDSFARAAHGLADFYAHSSYMHFAGDTLGPVPYDPAHFTLPVSYDEDSAFDIAGGEFSMNTHLFKETARDAADHWRGKLISGRYAQPHDTRPGIASHLAEGLTFIPRELLDAPDFSYRGGLPHHDEIAVDVAYRRRNKSHKLYGDAATYTRQLDWRTKAAAAHIAAAFAAHPGQGEPG